MLKIKPRSSATFAHVIFIFLIVAWSMCVAENEGMRCQCFACVTLDFACALLCHRFQTLCRGAMHHSTNAFECKTAQTCQPSLRRSRSEERPQFLASALCRKSGESCSSVELTRNFAALEMNASSSVLPCLHCGLYARKDLSPRLTLLRHGVWHCTCRAQETEPFC